ncbi:MAG: phosphotransferase [Austwickia sp.]|nr:phosphotransferase [Austwickia sp.]MBK8435956.1 phosphotransferase [Austwickia sp.]MBK9101639.1 phosphotransferase [Austwickia sp.]
MTPRSLTLAALACAAVPGTAPVSVTELSCPYRQGVDRFHTCVVTDSQGARWVVRLPSDAVADARQDSVLPFLRLVARRLPMQVPSPAGRMAVRDGRGAIVYPFLAGQSLNLAALPPRSTLTAAVGRMLAAVHNVDRRIVDEVALPSYEAQDCRRRHIADFDRGAATRKIPTSLLSRWERLLDDVTLWRFAPTVIHGRLDGSRILIAAADPEDIDTAEVVGLTGWDAACVGDPARDFTEIVRCCPPETADTVMEAYAMARAEPADPRLYDRAGLLSELQLMTAFLAADAAQDQASSARLGAELAALADRVGDVDPPSRAAPEPLFPTVAVDFSPPPVDEGLYHAGTVAPGAAVVAGHDAAPTPAPPVQLDARQAGDPGDAGAGNETEAIPKAADAAARPDRSLPPQRPTP